MTTAEEQRLLKPIDIPLIITSASSTPDSGRKFEKEVNLDSRTIDVKGKEEEEEEVLRRNSTGGRKQSDAKSRNVGGSLKYEIGRNKSASNLIGLPAKWSSVRIKGTGYNDSRKSVVKIEPCNGIPNIAKEYVNLKSPNSSTGHMKPHIGNVSKQTTMEREAEQVG